MHLNVRWQVQDRLVHERRRVGDLGIVLVVAGGAEG